MEAPNRAWAEPVIRPKNAVHRAGSEFCFDSFELNVAERSLKKAGEVIPLGGRAFDILLALVDRAGEVVNKSELFAKVWPNVTVEKVNLRVRAAKWAHPDLGGTADTFRKLVEARDRLLSALGTSAPAPKPPSYASKGATIMYRKFSR